VVSSFGKTFHVTGWKVGTVAAPAALTAEFRKVHQFNVFTVNTPVQHGLARYLADPHPTWLPAFYQRKRDLFREGLARTRLRLLPSEGTYFQLVDYSAVSELPRPSSASG
jgi:methionine transaminase